MVTSSRLLVALDVSDASRAVRLAGDVFEHVGGFKIGLGLLHGPGPGLVAALVDLGKPVLVDAKLHDIPSQTAAAARSLGTYGARWVTAHVAGGPEMLAAAGEGLADGAGAAPAGILGVTVLTSLDANTLRGLGIDRSPGKLVSSFARVAQRAGCEGIVCSPLELHVVAEVAPGLVKVTPGIRDASTGDDQARTSTPEEAIERGADWLVVGRPITLAADPVAAAEALNRRTGGFS